MRPCSAALQVFLEGNDREAIQIDLYTVQLVTGEVFRWTGGTIALTVPADGFPADSINAGADRTFALGPGFGRSKVGWKLGVEPESLLVDVYPSEADSIGTLRLGTAARLGLLDGATVELDRLFAPLRAFGGALTSETSGSDLTSETSGDPLTSEAPMSVPAPAIDTSLGCLVWFRGAIADLTIGRSVISLTVKSPLNRLSTTQFPTRVFYGSCSHAFGGAMCGYSRVAGENALGDPTGIGLETITATSGSTQSEIHSAFVPSTSPSPYIEGTIVGVTGANAGFTRTISDHQSGTVYFKLPFVYEVAVGDTFDILPGCPHTVAYCDGVLNNAARFGGFPHIPPPEYGI